jgi:hypothetical protein
VTDDESEDKAKPAEGEGDGAGGASNGKDPSAELDEAIAKLRGRVDVTAKAVGGLGMTAASAVGLAKIGDLFPISPGDEFHIWFVETNAAHLWFSAAIAGFVALAAAVLIVTFRLWSVNKPVLMRSSISSMRNANVGDGEELSPQEEKEVKVVYAEAARLNGVPSLRAYEARYQRLLRLAERTADADRKAKLESEAKQIAEGINTTLGLAALVVIRRRASNAVRGFGSLVAYSLLVSGIVLFALGTDYVSSERTEQITIAKNCADAREAGADAATLPEICGPDPAGEESDKTSAAEEQAKAATALGEPLQQCLALVSSGDALPGACRPIAQAMSALAASP